MDHTDKPVAPPEPSSGGSFWALMVLLVAAAATLIVLQGRRSRSAESEWAGQPLPPLEAGGWINTTGPLTADDLRGKVVLLDFWASDCMPCIHHLPELIAFNKRFRDKGVLVVGLSLENGQRAQYLKNFVETRAGLDWPVGYDARLAYEMLSVYGTPTYYLFDRSGRSVWGGHTLAGLEEAVVAALAK